MHYAKKALILLMLSVMLSSCLITGEEEATTRQAQPGYKPVYGARELREISFEAARGIKNPGKIYRYGSYLLVNEQGAGIHLFNNDNPADPQPLGFINVLGNTDMAIKDDILYADHAGNLVAIELRSFNDLLVKGSLPLKNWDLGIPPPRGTAFECVDPSKGIVIAWKKVESQNFECYALF